MTKRRFFALVFTLFTAAASFSLSAAERALASRENIVQLTNGVSIAEALERVAQLRGRDDKADIVLEFARKGLALAKPIMIDSVLQPRDAGRLIIRGANGRRVRLFGSRPVKKWVKVKNKSKSRVVVWEADVSGFKLADQLDALFMDGKMMTLARYPNINPKLPYSGGWAYVPGRWISMYHFPKEEPAGSRSEMLVGDKDWHNWAVPTEGRIVIFPRQRYGSSYVRIADLDRAGKRLKFAKNICDVPRPGDTYILSGFREELDDFGEWYHDLKGEKVYFIAPKGKDPNKSLVTIPTTGAIFKLDNAHNVSIENFELCAGRMAVDTKGCSFISIRGCSIHDFSAHRTIEFAWGHNNELRDSDIFNVAGSAVHITGGGITKPNLVENCYIHHVAMLDHSSSAIFMEGQGYKIKRNLFHDLPGWAVFHTGNHHELTDNRVHHYMLETEDGGAFYTCNSNGGIETVTAGNWISHGIGFAKAAGYGPLSFYNNSHGLYFDSGPNHGYIYDNVIERVSGMAFKVDGNNTQVVSNNVLYLTGRPELLRWSYAMNLSSKKSEGVDDFREGVAYSNRFVHNIWYYPHCPSQIYVLIQGADCTRNTFDWNWICIGNEAKHPEFRDGVSWEEHWRKKWNLDEHSLVVSSIGFVNPKEGDFTPKNKGIMKKLSIRPLVMKKCGLYVNEFRKTLPKEADGCANHPEWIRNPVDHINPPKK